MTTRAIKTLLSAAVALTLCAAPGSASPAMGLKKGEMVPDFLLPTIDGKMGRLSDYRGKKVLLFHFASW